MSPFEYEKIFKIVKINSSQSESGIYQRLLDLGFYEGMSVKIIRRVAFGGPWILLADNMYLALRDDEFRMLEIQ